MSLPTAAAGPPPGDTPPLVRLLGVPALCMASGRVRPLERKVAGLLAVLALDRHVGRSSLAGLLWPDSAEGAARNNLRQMLHRLRVLAGQPVLGGQQRPAFLPGVPVDVALLEVAAFAGRDAEVVAAQGELLSGHDYDDCPELHDWILAQRERLLGVQRQSRLTLVQACEAQGDLRGALDHAAHLLELEPVSEFAHRLLMTLHHQLGDRGAALRAYAHCRAVLNRDLGVAPMAETVALATQIATDGPQVPAPLSGPPPVPAWLGQPPVLVGRSGAWTQLEAGWAAGQALYIAGPPGVGKTRLGLDFLASKGGRVRLVTGRPEDAGLPYASVARTLRHVLADHPALSPPAWMRAELGRLLPELAPAAPPLHTPADKLRFYEALAQLIALAADLGDTRLLLDDLQFTDDLSGEAWNYVLAHPDVTGRVRVACTFRSGELPSAREAALRRDLETGRGRQVTLEPLAHGDVVTLLLALAPDAPAALGADLARSTGGNPLFMLETLRALHDAGVLARGWPQQVPHLPGLGAMMARRLEGLSGPALRVARTAAVAGPEFSPELAAQVLEVHPLDLAGAWTELTAAQVLVQGASGPAFSHDLLAQAALDALPAPILAVLHARVAQALQGGAIEPARLAHHWEQAGDPARAALWWIKAGWACCGRGADDAAAASFRRALAADLSAGDSLEARHGLGVALSGSDPAQAEAEFMHTVKAALKGGFTRQAITSQAFLADLYRKQGRLEAGRQAIEEALGRVPPGLVAGGAEAEEVADLWQTRFWLELRSGRLPAAESAIREAIRLAPAQPWLENERAMLLWHTGRIEEAALALDRLMGRLTPADRARPESLAALENNRAWTYWMLGRAVEAAPLLERALAKPSSPYDRGLHHSNLATFLTSLGHYRAALEHLELAAALLAPFDLHLADVLHRRGMVQYRADRFAQAREPLLSALTLARQVGDPYRLSYILASLAATQAHLGDLDAAQAHAAEAHAIAGQIRFPLTLVIASQGASVVARLGGDGAGATAHALEAAGVARACGMAEQLGQSLLLSTSPGPADPDTVTRQRPALEEALRLGRAHDLPDLTWRAALALLAARPSPPRATVRAAQQAAALLRRESPSGWF